ncbi:hypothetical protein [Lysobacter olei]
MTEPRRLARAAMRPLLHCAQPRRLAAALSICVALWATACSRPEPPDKERPPEPQASVPARHTELRDAIQAPQDKARAVEGAVDDAAKAQRDAIEAAGG